MSYVIENVNDCTKKIAFNFETLDLSGEVKTALLEKQKDVNLKGFRKGKAPLAMVEQMYGPQIETEALNSFIQNKLFEVINSEKLRMVGYPNFENMKYDAGKSVSFEAVVEIFPEVELKDFSGLSFTKDKVEISEDDVDQMKKNYLNNKAEMVEITEADLALGTGHFAVLNFEGEKEDGERPENMKGEDFVLEIGSGQFIPGFEEGMAGMKKGEKKVIELTFPEEYHAEDLKNAKVKFHVELLEIKEKTFPEFSDELSKEFGFESVEDFKTKTEENLKGQKTKESKDKLHQEILEKLVEENSFDVPLALVVQQEQHVKEDLQRTLQSQGFNEEMLKDYFEKWKDDMTGKAQFQVRSGLILDQLSKKYEVEVSDADFDAKLTEIAGTSGLDMEQVKQYYTSDEKMKNNLTYAIREEKTFEKICENLTITEK
jgi:trigger factor